MKYEVIDNFLDKEYFDNLVTRFTDKEKTGNIVMPWYFASNIAYDKVVEDKIFFFCHMFYSNNVPQSPLYNELLPLLDKLEMKCLIRIKGNLYPNTHKLHEHPMHVDFPMYMPKIEYGVTDASHSAAILSLNTCDGYTKLKDGTKIDSVANRLLLFDSSEEHCSTTTTNVPARINININYI